MNKIKVTELTSHTFIVVVDDDIKKQLVKKGLDTGKTAAAVLRDKIMAENKFDPTVQYQKKLQQMEKNYIKGCKRAFKVSDEIIKVWGARYISRVVLVLRMSDTQ